MKYEDQFSTLSHDYVCNHIFKKLSDTFDKYRLILPPVSEVEEAITKVDQDEDDFFALTMHVLSVIKKHAENSPLIAEIQENVKRDFWHGIDPKKVQQHQGKYYIDSVVD